MASHPSFGISDVDKLMGGGMLSGRCYLMEVEPGVEEMGFIGAFLNEGLRQRNFCSLVLYDQPNEYVIDKLTEFGVNGTEALSSGSLVIVDLWGKGKYDPEHRGPILMTDNPSDSNSAFRLYVDLAKISEEKLNTGKFRAPSRAVISSVSAEVMNFKFEQAYKLVRGGLHVVRQQNAISLATIDPKMFDETVVASFEHLYDGVVALSMKEVKGTFQRFIRVKQSPLPSFYTGEVPYEVIGGTPRLATSFSEPLSVLSQLKLDVDGTVSLLGSRIILGPPTYLHDLIKHFINSLGYEVVAKEVYELYKSNAQTMLKGLLLSSDINVSSTTDLKNLLESITNRLSALGYGLLKLKTFSDKLVTLELTNSISSEDRTIGKPMHPYVAGVLAGIMEFLSNKPVDCTETKCMAKGDDHCEFVCQWTH